jgi:hypothetical protein
VFFRWPAARDFDISANHTNSKRFSQGKRVRGRRIATDWTAIFIRDVFHFHNVKNEKVAARLKCAMSSWKHTLATVSKSTFFRCLSATSPGASTRTKQTRLCGTLIVSPARVMEQCLRNRGLGASRVCAFDA